MSRMSSLSESWTPILKMIARQEQSTAIKTSSSCSRPLASSRTADHPRCPIESAMLRKRGSTSVCTSLRSPWHRTQPYRKILSTLRVRRNGSLTTLKSTLVKFTHRKSTKGPFQGRRRLARCQRGPLLALQRPYTLAQKWCPPK